MGDAQYDWLIFDVGGVVVPEAGDTIEREAARCAGVDHKLLSEALREPFERATSGEITLLQMYAGALESLGSDVCPQKLLDAHLMEYHKHSSDRVPGTIDLIARLRKKWHVACLTNTEHEIAQLNKERGLFEPFERAYLSTDIGMRKPQPEIWRAVLNDLGCAAVRAVYVDDRQPYVDVACELGMCSLLFNDAATLERELKPLLGAF